MVMAAFKAVGGPNAVYYVVPLLGALTVWLTFVLGSRLGRTARRPVGGNGTPGQSRVPVPAHVADERRARGRMVASVDCSRRSGNDVELCRGRVGRRPCRPHQAEPRRARRAVARLRGRLVPRECATATVPRPYSRVRCCRVRLRLARSIAICTSQRSTPGYGSFSTIYASEHFWPNLLNYAAWLLRRRRRSSASVLAAPLLFHRRGDRRRAPSRC